MEQLIQSQLSRVEEPGWKSICKFRKCADGDLVYNGEFPAEEFEIGDRLTASLVVYSRELSEAQAIEIDEKLSRIYAEKWETRERKIPYGLRPWMPDEVFQVVMFFLNPARFGLTPL